MGEPRAGRAPCCADLGCEDRTLAAAGAPGCR